MPRPWARGARTIATPAGLVRGELSAGHPGGLVGALGPGVRAFRAARTARARPYRPGV